MIDFFFNLDFYLFYFINTYLSNPIFDSLFVFFHDCHKKIWVILLVLFFWIFFIYKHKNNRILLILLIPIGITLTDQIGSAIKNLELRQRPYTNIEKNEINLLIKVAQDENGTYKKTKSSEKSFPSNHAANMFFIGTFLSLIYSNRKKYFITLACLVAISRVYIGVHYPFDTIFGSLIGASIAYFLIYTYKKLIRQNIIR